MNIELLKNFFENKKEIELAVLFGSRAEDRYRRTSDYDIGIFLTEELSKKEKRDFRDKIWTELEIKLNKDLDLILLNEAPPLFLNRILSTGKIILIRNRNLYLDLLINSTREAEDLCKFCQEYYQIFERSSSLNPIDKVRIERILIFLDREMKDINKFKNLKIEDYKKNSSLRRDVERFVENLINSILDIFKIILASQKFCMPETYREVVIKMKEVEGFDTNNLLEKFANWVKLRNILAHEYMNIKFEEIKEFLEEGFPLLEKIILKVKAFIK